VAAFLLAVVLTLRPPACAGKVRIEFQGTPPFSASWNGEPFTTGERTLERQAVDGDNWLTEVTDASPRAIAAECFRYDAAEHRLPTPRIRAMPWICPDEPVSEAMLDEPLPEGLELVWTLENARVLRAVGELVTFERSGRDMVVTAVYRRSVCTSAPARVVVADARPAEAPFVMVVPSRIVSGGAALVYVTVGDGLLLPWAESSLGDAVTLLHCDDWPVCTWQYRSTHGAGLATIRVSANGKCNAAPVQSTVTLEITGR
jgi:hypothetical protein